MHGEKQWGGLISQLFVHPSYRRGTSLFLDLERTLLREYRGFGLDFLYYLITIKPMLKAHLNLGFARGPDLYIYAFPLALGKGLLSIRGGAPRLVAAGLDRLSRVVSSATFVIARHARRTLDIREVAGAGDLDEELLARAHAKWGIRAERTNDALRRRFQQFGNKHYTIFAAVSGGRDQGYIVLRRTNVQGFDVLAILDVAVPEDAADARRSLLLHACRQGIRANCDAVACLERPGTAEARALRSCLFFRTPAYFTLIADRDSRLVAEGGPSWAGEWYANWFDHDYI